MIAAEPSGLAWLIDHIWAILAYLTGVVTTGVLSAMSYAAHRASTETRLKGHDHDIEMIESSVSALGGEFRDAREADAKGFVSREEFHASEARIAQGFGELKQQNQQIINNQQRNFEKTVEIMLSRMQ